MSGVTTATVIGASIASAAIGAGASMYSAHKTSNAQKSAADQQAEASRKALNQQKSEFARQNQNQADVGSLLEGNTGNETGSTLLTSPLGVDPNQLKLGKGTSLLGG